MCRCARPANCVAARRMGAEKDKNEKKRKGKAKRKKLGESGTHDGINDELNYKYIAVEFL